MNRLIISALALCGNFAFAQSYVAESALESVSRDGFYRIDLSPGLMPNVNAALSNVRIVGEKEQEVPYVLKQDVPARYTSRFKNYTIVEHERVRNCCTTLILENKEGASINNVNLFIRNADVSKEMVLTGSDDRETWYALKDRSRITAESDGRHTAAMRIVNFPLSNYRYYKISISDSNAAPLNI